MNALQSSFEIDTTAQELRQLLVEAEFNSRWMLIEAYHEAGRLISELQKDPNNPLGKEDLVQQLAGKVNKSERMLWYAVRFYEVYPDLNSLPEGKNIGWTKVVKKYLTTPKEEDCLHPVDSIVRIEIVKCSECGRTIESNNKG